ncbi:MAG: anaerobic ribonucleoside-triphosphate reductase activating protein [Desulfobacterales bacterium]|nr:anaerobic ribonucleoside-triphosphate reductase activating protein [Desulfobacterales bacterium]
MILAGIQKTSLIDFPDKISCVVFVTGCNFTCPFCHNPELARGRFPQRITLDQLLAFLEPRRMLLDGVVISGGEPTLSPGLATLCRAIREMGLSVKLDTNGSRPEVLARLIEEGLLDYIAMDLKTDLSHYGPPLVAAEEAGPIRASLRRSIHLIMTSGLDHEFRTTCVRPFVDANIIINIAQAIQGARRYVLQPFRDVSLLDPVFLASQAPGFTPSEMEQLKTVAAPIVAQCFIRS